MRITNWLSRSFAKWTFAIGCVSIGSLAIDSQAFGHYPFHHHRHGGFGSYGWGSHYYGNYYGGYSSFYGLSSSYYYPSVSFRFVPRYYSVNYYTPTYFAPVYYPHVYYPPVYYAPAVSPCSTWGSVQTNVGFPVASSVGPTRTLSADSFVASQVNSPVALSARQFQSVTPLRGIQVSKLAPMERDTEIEEAVVNEPGIKLVSKKPALLQPYSPIWTKAAVGIVDDMVAAGELDHAHSSCKSMERITQPKGAGVYLRQALLSYFSADASSTSAPSTSETLKFLELACEAGSQVQPSELAKNSLQDYFAPCKVDITRNLDQLSKSVLESPNNAGGELLLLAALLKLDGQQDRAKLFANEVDEQFAKAGTFRWHRLLDACLN